MKQLNKSDIIETILVCPYCYETKGWTDGGCCGESNSHFETAYVTKESIFLESETEFSTKTISTKEVNND